MSVQIAPSVLAADFGHLADAVAQADAAGADMIHFDVMDGRFVPNLTFGPPLVQAVRPVSKLPFDVHLMVERPWDLIEAFADAGANYLTVHEEACPDLVRVLSLIRRHGVAPGVSLNPHTPLESVRYALPDAELLLIMTVSPGFGGQEMLAPMLDKIAAAARLVAEVNPKCLIEVDGGIDVITAPRVVRAGARVLVAGSAVYGTPSVSDAVRELRCAASEALT
ncbi:MAG: ribulose-phosphate 3-epimerase [Fimbriimonadales bacterium]